jgi:hypothetical protein
MRAAGQALRGGLQRLGRAWALCVFLLAVNLATALVLAVPLLAMLTDALDERPAAVSMMRGFDYPWWSRWADAHPGWPSTLGPDLLGAGFALKNVDLVLKGQFPAALFAMPDAEGKRAVLLDPLLLAVAAAYMLVQVFLQGGVLSVLRQARGGWTMRGMLHGAGFYCGRFLRVFALMMIALALLFALYVPLAAFADGRAREAVSERTAEAWLIGRHAVMLVALLFVHVVGTYARVIIVLEERSSAVLAVLSGLTFALRNLLATLGIMAGMAALVLAAFGLWLAFDGAWTTMGYVTQAPTFLAMQALVLARIAARVGLAGSLMDLYRRRAPLDPPLAARA